MRVRRVLLVAAVVLAGLAQAGRAEAAIVFFTELTPPSAQYAGAGVRPLPGDFNGDGRSDVLFYRPGAGAEVLKFGTAGRTFTTVTSGINATATYQPLLGDFDGSGTTDIFWYAPGTQPDSIWYFTPTGGHTTVTLAVNGTYKALVGDWVRPGGPTRDEIFWYGPGATADSMWAFGAAPTGARRVIAQTVRGSDYTPLVGGFTPETGPDYEGSVDLSVDIFWYSPSGPDSLWDGDNAGGFTSSARSIGSGYQPFVGLFDGYGVDDIFWYAPGGADQVWLPDDVTGAFNTYAATIGSGRRPITGGFLIPNEPIYWWAPAGTDEMWFPQGEPGDWEYDEFTTNTDMGAGYTPVTGDFDGDGRNDLYWIHPGATADAVWYGPNPDA